MLRCEVCGAEYRIIDSAFVCEEGHMLEENMEVVDELEAMPTPASLIQPEEELVGTSIDGLEELTLCHMLFEELKRFFGVEDSRYFRMFLNFFQLNGRRIMHGPQLCYTGIMALLYHSRRMEEERRSATYMMAEFLHTASMCPYEDRLLRVLELLRIRAADYENKMMKIEKTSCQCIYNFLSMLSRPGVGISLFPSIKPVPCETGVLDEHVEYAKTCFRQDIRNDYENMCNYLHRICGAIGLEIDEDMGRRFKVFAYASDFTFNYFIPELEICAFLCIYIAKQKRTFDVERALAELKVGGSSAVANNSFQSNLRLLFCSITGTTRYTFERQVFRVKARLSSLCSLKSYRKFSKKENEPAHVLFIRSVLYIAKLLYRKFYR
jgi:hypothetical protein